MGYGLEGGFEVDAVTLLMGALVLLSLITVLTLAFNTLRSVEAKIDALGERVKYIEEKVQWLEKK